MGCAYRLHTSRYEPGKQPTSVYIDLTQSPCAFIRLRVSQELHPGDAEGCQQTLQSFIYPAGSSADDNPMYVLCCNDTCSFTWTGAEHVNQVRRRWEEGSAAGGMGSGRTGRGGGRRLGDDVV